MKRTLDVNIGGFVFHLDEDAYTKLDRYIESLKRHYKDSEEGKEIISDIESRMAELLHEKKSGTDTVICMEDITEVISILGDPEEIFEEEEPKVTYKVTKKLYRDPDDRILGGVASGLAAFLGLPVALVRILYIVFAFASLGIAALIYIIFWIVVPKAITARQKLEMKGDPINVSNIEKSIKEEYSEVKKNIKTKSPKIRKDLNTFWERVHGFFLGLGRVILVLIGCLFLAISVTVLLSLIGTLFLTNWVIIPLGDLHLYNIVPELLLNTSNTILFMISLFLVCGIPFIMLLYAGLKLIFRFKTNSSLIVISMVCLWIFGIINMALISTDQLKHYSKKTTNYSEPRVINPVSKNTIYIRCNNEPSYRGKNNIDLGNIKITERDGKTILMGTPELNFEKSESDKFEIILKRESRGIDRTVAYENIKNINYDWNFQDSVLYLNKYFTVNGKQYWRAQEIEVIVKVPEGQNIVLDKNISRRIDLNSYDFYDYYRNYKGSKKWEMTESGKLQVIE